MRAALIFLITVVLAACTVSRAPESPAHILSGALSPASLGKNLSLSQIVKGSVGGQTGTLWIEVESNVAANHLVMVGLSPLGAPIFTLTLDGRKISSKTFIDNFPLAPEAILADFQIAHWPVEIIAENMSKRGYTISIDPISRSRTIQDHDCNVALNIRYSPLGSNSLVLQRFKPDYVLHVSPL